MSDLPNWWHYNCDYCGTYGDASGGFHNVYEVVRHMAQNHATDYSHVVSVWQHGLRLETERKIGGG